VLIKIFWLLRGFLALINPKTWGVFQETYRNTKFDSAFNPSWSQAGEDISIHSAVSTSCDIGFYLDIGAHDPNRFSVTRKLYDKGWHGLDIDGNGNFESKFREMRPRSDFRTACVGSKGEYTFTIYKEGAISTTNPDWVRKFSSEGNVISEVVRVKGITLRELLDLPEVPKKVDFVNIDVEGADEDALRSIEFETLPKNRFPNWILLETAPPVGTSLQYPAVKYAIEHGYTPWLVLPMATLLKAPTE
jgi:FkbM family methyltransferase